MLKKWKILSAKSDNIIDQLLINRNIDLKDKKNFLKPDFGSGFYNPFKMLNMNLAVARVKKALKNQENILIYGDYDADGIPGSVLMYEVLKKIGAKPRIYISQRSQGYGINLEVLKNYHKKNIKLIIAVDNGTRNTKEINWAKKNGIDFIICDHHEFGKSAPQAIILNPKNPKCPYPFKELSGGGVVYKFTQALSTKFPKVKIADLKWWLELAAISTICDVVPLVDENRVIAKFGLIALQKTKRVGLLEIFNLAQIDQSKISTYTVGFQIGPRLNAPSRMALKSEGFWILATKNQAKAKKIAAVLEKTNRDRQQLLDKTIKQAEKIIIKNHIHKKKVILICEKDWPTGIVGLVAGKLVEKYARPAIVLERGDQESKGSARSVDGFHLINALEESKKHLISFGGHTKAAGLSLENEHLEDLYNQLLEIAENQLEEEDLKPKITIDYQLVFNQIRPKLVSDLNMLEPYGLGNPKPIFISSKIIITNMRFVGANQKHLKISFRDQDGNQFDAIGFDLSILRKYFQPGDIVDIAYNIDLHEWMGRKSIELRLIDMQKTKN